MTSSQKPVEAPQERPKHSLTDNTIADNEHVRTNARAQLEVVRVQVAAEKREESAKRLAEAIAAKKAEDIRKAELARASERAITKAKQVRSTKESAKTVVVSRSTNAEAPTKRFEATAYIAMCKSGCIGITASGYDVRNTIKSPSGLRIIAAPKSIPFGTIVRVNTGEESFNAVVLDRGGDIIEGRIDLLVGSEAEAFRFGRQTVTVQVLKSGK